MTTIYDPANPRHIALRLTHGQASVIRGLDAEGVMLGCGEDVATRLTKGSKRRPPLVRCTRIGGDWHFWLNAMGCAVKAALAEISTTEGTLA